MGKRRQIVQVDEEKLKMMIAGDIPVKADVDKDIIISPVQPGRDQDTPPGKEYMGTDSTVSPDTEDPENDSPDPKKYNKRKRNKVSYSEQFLYKPEPAPRRQSSVHLDESNYRNITLILKITDNMSIANFINNILAHHFELYKDEIDETVKEYFDNLYKR